MVLPVIAVVMVASAMIFNDGKISLLARAMQANWEELH